MTCRVPWRTLAGLAMLCTWLGLAAPRAWAAPEIPAADAQRDLRILQRALTELHPGLYRYASPAQIDAEFSAAQAAVAQGASRAELYLLASRIAAAVRCGHTWVNRYNQGPAVQAMLAQAMLPLVLRWVEGRILVVASTVPQVPAGGEITAIDGRTPAQIAEALLPYLRADGGRDATRRAQLDDDDTGGAMQRLFPLRFPPGPAGWALRLADGRETTVAPMTAAAREAALQAAGWRAPPTDWTLRIDGDAAVMTLPTFAFWNSRFDGRAWLAQAFAELSARGVRRLVIDLRRNEGGDDALGDALLSHLIGRPFTAPGGRRESAYERVPYILARYLDTWDFDFFDRTGQVTRGPGRNWLLPDSPARNVAPAPPRFDGRVAALIGPRNSSAGFLLAQALRRAGAATLVGQPTGGSQRGLNGGQLAWVTLPASGVAVDIPLIAHLAAGDPPDDGVAPDVPVAERFDDARAGRDTALAAALAATAATAETAATVVKAVPAVEPRVLLAPAPDGRPLAEGDRRVRGCGLRAVFPGGPVVEVLNLREGDATVMRLTVDDPSAPGGAVSLATAGEDTRGWLQADGALQARGAVDADAGARLFQQLMVGGGTVRIDRGGVVQTLSIPGPLAPGLRSAYLNCAGDLFPRTR